ACCGCVHGLPGVAIIAPPSHRGGCRCKVGGPGKELECACWIEIAAGQDCDGALAAHVQCPAAQRGHGRSARELDDEPALLQQQCGSLDDLVVTDGDDLVHVPQCMRDGEVAGPHGHESVRNGTMRLDRNGMTGTDGLQIGSTRLNSSHVKISYAV